MNQENTGKFIAQCRKEMGLTQASLAEKLGITDRAVSKWETGKSMPDASLMLELCEILKINVNELLSGEHISMDHYQDIAEQNLIEIKKQETIANKKLLFFESVLILIAMVPALVMSITASYLCTLQIDTIQLIFIIALYATSILCVVTAVIVGLKIEHEAGYYECPNCGKRYVPTMKSIVMATHYGRTRKMTCPYCNKKAYHKKVLSR